METQNTFEQCISKMNKITAFSFLTTRCFVVLINNIAAEQKKTIASMKFVVWVQHKESNKYPIYFDKLFVNMAFNLRFLNLLLKHQWALGKKYYLAHNFI